MNVNFHRFTRTWSSATAVTAEGEEDGNEVVKEEEDKLGKKIYF